MNKILIVLLNILLLPDIVLASNLNYGDICANSGVGSVMIIVGNIINVVKWIAPLVIIVLGMVDFGKVVISNDEKAINKATIALIRRVVAGLVIFFVPTLIGACTKILLDVDLFGESNQFIGCTNCMFNVDECEETVRLLKEQEEEKKNQEKEEYEQEKEEYEDSGDWELVYTSANSHTNSINGIKYKLYNQSDSAWGNVKFSNGQTISDNGCMISAVAVLSSAHNADINPKTVFDSSYRHAWPHNGVNNLSENNFSCTKTTSINYNDIKTSLKTGDAVIIQVKGESPFTGSQHYMSLIDIKSDGSEVFVGNSYGTGTGTYNRTGWFSTNTVLKDVHEVYTCTPKASLINKFKESPSNNITSSSSITFNYEYKTDADLRYVLYSPSSASSNKKTPLIVWLHGSGEQNASESVFKNSGLLRTLNNWKLDGFNAYVLCPISSGAWKGNRDKVYNLIEKIKNEKNINTNKIILVGHSMGGIGVQTIADGNASFFSSLVILSGYNAGVDLNQFKGMPIRAYVGTTGAGEDSASYNFTTSTFTNTFGSDKRYILSTSHGNLPNAAFNLDENKDNKSDLVEWMLKQ